MGDKDVEMDICTKGGCAKILIIKRRQINAQDRFFYNY